MTVRVRIAPSPTGEPHIGTMYTALANETFARREGGQFILRIEDTDQSRSTPDSERKIMEAFTWLGLQWDEGPDKGGPYGPYRQSERKAIYHVYAERLLRDGHAFRCFCTAERLETMRKKMRALGKPTQYDGLCLKCDPQEAEARAASGEPHVLRMKVPKVGACEFTDGVYGPVAMPWSNIDMQVLVKSDGMPTYHLANVVDDTEMKITHVIRGEEWMSSTPKHLLLYQYLGLKPPEFVHLPLMRALDRSKLSKRRNPTSISWFEAQGYLPEALVNFLGLFFVRIGEGDEELMTRDEYVHRFDFGAASKAGAVFDMKKLDWVNARWLRERTSPEDFRRRVLAWGDRGGLFTNTIELARSRIEKLSDLGPLMTFLFAPGAKLDEDAFAQLKLSREHLRVVLQRSGALVESLPEWSGDALFAAVSAMAKELGLKTKDVTPALFLAITGETRSLPVFQAMEIMGRSVCRERLRAAARLIGEDDTPATEQAHVDESNN